MKTTQLAVSIMESIRLDKPNEIGKSYRKGYVDPWRVYQDLILFGNICEYIQSIFEEKKIDLIISVSDLGLPLAISIALMLSKNNQFDGQTALFVDTDSKAYKLRPEVSLIEKNIIICDDILAGGGHMKNAYEKLVTDGAIITHSIVLLDNLNDPYREPANEFKRLMGEKFISLTDSSRY